jgi:hypothetical protein
MHPTLRAPKRRPQRCGMQAGKTVEATLPANLECTVLYRDRIEMRLWARARLADAIFANDALSQLSYSPTVWKRSIQKILSAFVRLGHSEFASLLLSITFQLRISVN